MIEMFPCAIGSIPGVGSQGMSSAAAGEREPANVSSSPPASPGVVHVEEKRLRRERRLGQPPDEAGELVPSGSEAGRCRRLGTDTCPCDPMSVSLPRRAPSLREPLRAKLPVDPAPRMSPPPTPRMSPATAVKGRSPDRPPEPRRPRRPSPHLSPSAAACSQRDERKKENRCSRGSRMLLPGPSFSLRGGPASRLGPKAHSNEGSSGSSVRSLTESRPPRPLAGRSLVQESRACRRPRTETYDELSGTAAR